MSPALSVQQRLRAAGFDPGPLDGVIGPRTLAALEAALARATQPGLTALFADRPVPPALDAADIAEAAARLRLEPARLRAVIAVESAGRGFHPVSGRPIILYEPHVFHRETAGRHSRERPDLSYPRWGARSYPRTQAERWVQLASAAALDATAALRATSWGLFQIMGFNHRLCGFDAVEAFAEAHARSERDQLLAFTAFVQARRLDAPLREGRWAEFARGYNGPAFARHAYDRRLASACERTGEGVGRPGLVLLRLTPDAGRLRS